jgi:hypothetical protein
MPTRGDFSRYEASFGAAITAVGCMAHARRKFLDLHASNKGEINKPIEELLPHRWTPLPK